MGQLHDNFKASIGKIVTALKNWSSEEYAIQDHIHGEYALIDHDHDLDYSSINHTHTTAQIDDIEIISLTEYEALAVKDNKLYICLE